MILGEGAALFVMESLDHAKARGARIYAEVAGYASGNAAFDSLRPEPNGNGMVHTLKRTLREAGMQPQEIDVIHGQGLSLPEYDAMEARCLWETFGKQDKTPAVTAVSSWIGNSLGGLGAFQAATNVLMLERQMVPTIANYHAPVNESLLRFVDKPVTGGIRAVLQNAYCFMGKSSSLIFKRME